MLNTTILQGRFTKDPEVKTTAGGTTICSFQLACDRSGSKEKTTDFIPCVTFGKTAEFVSKYFARGKMAVVSGQLQSRNYEAADGAKRTAYEVFVKDINFCGDKATNGSSAPTQAQQAATAPANNLAEEEIDWDKVPDLPFEF